jgi:hypothetical protein
MACRCLLSRMEITNGHCFNQPRRRTRTQPTTYGQVSHNGGDNLHCRDLGGRSDCQDNPTLPGTMDVAKWHQAIRKHWRDQGTQPTTNTYTKRCCTCGQYFPTLTTLDDHILPATTQSETETHARFCGECPRGGGCYNILNTKTADWGFLCQENRKVRSGGFLGIKIPNLRKLQPPHETPGG